uniref:Cyclic GMP-AMP synthase n=1 Tax=Moschus moschiferus TaxID=68415 RepID=A0A8C6CR34_MOSMO
MAPPRRRATRRAPGAASGVSAPGAEGGASAEPSEPAAVPEAARPGARRCGPAGAPGSRRESGRQPRETPQVRARGRAEEQAEGPAAPAAGAEPPAAPGHRASARSRATARPSRARRPQSGPPAGPGPHLGRREEAPGAWKPRAVLEKLKLSRQEISVAAEVVNRLVDHLLRRLNSCESEFRGVDLLRTGSYYERVKISAPNEFDIINPKGSPLDQFLEGGILSASKMLSRFRKIIKEEIKNIEDTDVIMERKRRGSPAVTLLIRKPREISVDIILALESRSSWPASTQKGLPINNWLGTKVKNNLKRQPFYLVPKHAKEGSFFQEETWRLSFSHVEKAILINHGQSKTCCEVDGVKCCRKDCLKLMKYLLEQLKKKFGNRRALDKFCSYHVKTAFFHVCTQDPQDSQWHHKDLELCFDNCVTFFLQCLKTERLEHYFIPDVNLFSRDQIDKLSKEFLSKQIEYERNNGFPVFDEF